MDGLLSNPSPGTRSSNAVGSHIEERTFASLCHRQRQRRRRRGRLGDFVDPRSAWMEGALGINDHSGAITRVRRCRRRCRLVSNHPRRRARQTHERIRRINDPSGLDFKGETRDVDGWRETDRVTTKRAKPHGNVSRIKLHALKYDEKRSAGNPLSRRHLSLCTLPRGGGGRGWKKIRLLFLESRDYPAYLSSVSRTKATSSILRFAVAAVSIRAVIRISFIHHCTLCGARKKNLTDTLAPLNFKDDAFNVV